MTTRGSKTTTRRGTLGRSLAGLLATSLVAFGAVLPAAAATTTATPPFSEAVTGLNSAAGWLGSYKLDNATTPVYAQSTTATRPNGSYGAGVADPLTTASYQLSYLMAKDGSSNSSNTQAALAALVTRYGGGAVPLAGWNQLSAAEQGLAGSMWTQAASQAGPYYLSVGLPITVNRGEAATAVASVTSAAGNPVSGMPVALVGAGASVSTNAAVTGADGKAYFTFTVPTSATGGSYTLTASISYGRGTQHYVSGLGGGRPVMIGVGAPFAHTASASSTYSTIRSVSLLAYRAGDAAKKALAGVSFKLIGPDGSTVTSASTTASTSSLGWLTEGASYKLVVTGLPAGSYGVGTSQSFNVGISSAPQTVELVVSSVPSISASLSLPSSVQQGGTASGSLILRGDDGEAGSAQLGLYGPLPSSSCHAASAAAWHSKLYTHKAIDLHGDGSYGFSASAPRELGCYAWGAVVSLPASGVSKTIEPGAAGTIFEVVSAPVTTSTTPASTTTTAAPVTTTTMPTPTSTLPVTTTTVVPSSGGKGGLSGKTLLFGLLFLLILLLLIWDIWRRRKDREDY